MINNNRKIMLPLMIALLMCFIPLNYGCYSKENKLNSKKADNLPSAPPQGKVKNEPNNCLGCGQSNDKTNQFIPVVLGDVIDLVCGKELSQLFCTSVAVNNYIKNYNDLHQDQLDLNSIYELRDNYLINYEVGQKYITYYYIISKILYDNGGIDKDNFIMHYDGAKAVLTASKILRSGKSSDIPFTNEFKEKNQNLILNYKGLSKTRIFI
jgi:hypothetical protein